MESVLQGNKRTKYDQLNTDNHQWDKMIKDFVLHGLYREFLITFRKEDVIPYRSPVFKRVVLQFSKGMRHVSDCVDLEKQPEETVMKWWEGKRSGARYLLQRMANKRSNVLHAIKTAMKGEKPSRIADNI